MQNQNRTNQNRRPNKVVPGRIPVPEVAERSDDDRLCEAGVRLSTAPGDGRKTDAETAESIDKLLEKVNSDLRLKSQ